MSSEPITPGQRAILRGILAPYRERIERVGLFGSRATGTARANSDIDLVIYGALNQDDIARISTLFGESALSVTVDVVAYPLLAHAPLRRHIDAVMRPLFEAGDLGDAG